jgi:hypothetical protein
MLLHSRVSFLKLLTSITIHQNAMLKLCLCILRTEHIYIGMQLFSSLLLLGGVPFLSSYGPQLVSACTAYVGEVVERGVLLMLPPVDLLLVAAPQQAAPLVLPFMQVCG